MVTSAIRKTMARGSSQNCAICGIEKKIVKEVERKPFCNDRNRELIFCWLVLRLLVDFIGIWSDQTVYGSLSFRENLQHSLFLLC